MTMPNLSHCLYNSAFTETEKEYIIGILADQGKNKGCLRASKPPI